MLPHTIEAGQHVRITLLKPVWGWAGNERTIVDAAGTIYEGVVGDTNADLFFALMLDDGSTLRFSLYDANISVEVLA